MAKQRKNAKRLAIRIESFREMTRNAIRSENGGRSLTLGNGYTYHMPGSNKK